MACDTIDMLSFMINTFSAAELATWAVLDVHTYYAWDSSHSGCMVSELVNAANLDLCCTNFRNIIFCILWQITVCMQVVTICVA